MSGRLYIVAAPSGAGKTSLVRALLDAEPALTLSVSYTSRPPRPSEIDGTHYHFVDRARFEAMVAEAAFFEYAKVHGDWKGTAACAVQPILDAGRDVLLEIDWQGARQVRDRVPDAVGIFILPPSHAELERRMRARGQDSDDVIARRVANSSDEIAHAGEFDYWVVNDDFDCALADLRAILRAERCRSRPGRADQPNLLTSLLSAPAQ